ncbi:hypothetical protein DPEC_G00368120 [Dallia pectoralis]|nr:hypothetical protein DPEC_G00368120 [Dallia pectoralis]
MAPRDASRKTKLVARECLLAAGTLPFSGRLSILVATSMRELMSLGNSLAASFVFIYFPIIPEQSVVQRSWHQLLFAASVLRTQWNTPQQYAFPGVAWAILLMRSDQNQGRKPV